MTLQAKAKLQRQKQGLENYVVGTNFEFKVLSKEKRNSVFAIRSAGSHSPVDVLSRKKNGEYWLISCKANALWTDRELNELMKLKSQLRGGEVIKLAYYVNGKRWVLKTF